MTVARITIMNIINNSMGLRGSALFGPVSLHASHHSIASAAHKAETLGIVKPANPIKIKKIAKYFIIWINELLRVHKWF
jgi:hypothetical protein